jgi:hypothetical protein
MKTCGAIQSFLPSSIVPGGDGVVKLWGPERAAGSMATRMFLRAVTAMAAYQLKEEEDEGHTGGG